MFMDIIKYVVIGLAVMFVLFFGINFKKAVKEEKKKQRETEIETTAEEVE